MDPFGQLPTYSTLAVQNDHHHHSVTRGVLPGPFGSGIVTHSANNRTPGGDYNMQHSIEGILGSTGAGNGGAGSTPPVPVTNGRPRSLSTTGSPGKFIFPLCKDQTNVYESSVLTKFSTREQSDCRMTFFPASLVQCFNQGLSY